MADSPPRRTRVFVSASHADAKHLNRLHIHLAPYQLDIWDRTRIKPSTPWQTEMKQALATTKVAIVLVSADFLAEDFIIEHELAPLLEAAEQGDTHIVPVIVSPCAFEQSDLACYQSLNSPTVPLKHMSHVEQEDLWSVLAKYVNDLLTAAAADSELPHLPDISTLHKEAKIPVFPPPPKNRPGSAASRREQNRKRMLDAVRAIWITGMLEQVVPQKALLALGLREQPTAVAHPWQQAVQDVKHAPRDLPTGTRITQAFDEAGGKLLILGAPGAGKTTLLLELARDLLARAKHDEQHPIPVIFSLSSWTSDQPRLADWLVDEMKLKYHVPEKVGRAWVENQQLLPLLDGLDEAPKDQRASCVQAINDYQQREEYGLTSLVVTSREAEYLASKTLIVLQTAVTVKPLTREQIDQYLSSANRHLEGVRAALRNDHDLETLATTPLMLNILSLAYQEQSAYDLLATPLAKRQHHLFATYVQRMLSRRSAARYTPEETRRWLSWLAQHMTRHQQTEFYLERLQPTWLPNAHFQRRYERLIKRFVGSLFGLVAGLLTGLLVGQSGGLGGILLGVFVGGPSGILIGGLAGQFMYHTSKDSTIQPAEILSWKWGNIWQGYRRDNLLVMLLIGLILGLAGWFIGGITLGLGGSPFGWVAGGLLIALSMGMANGWSSDTLDTSKLCKPNEGIWRSARNSLRSGISIGLVFGVIFGLAFWFAFGLTSGLIFGLFGWLAGGLASGLIFGGEACIQHLALRLMLRQAGCVPKGYVVFLDYAASCLLLRKVGGGYSFIHSYLLDYFAAPEPIAPSERLPR
jgi:DNA polymerase III delta prime subunit